jgi:DNA-binding transcriptional LysR family regulator
MTQKKPAQTHDQFALDGRLLRMFLSIYERNSISRAAQDLGVNQSTISHALDRMRIALDDPLFIKKGRGITPTEGAIALVPQVQLLVAGYEALSGDQIYDPSSDHSMITLACNVTELTPFLELFYAHVRQSAPHIVVRLAELGAQDGLATTLEAGHADLAVSARLDRYAASLQSALLYADPHVIYYDPMVRGRPMTSYEYSKSVHGVLDFSGTATSYVRSALDHAGIKRDNIALMCSNSFALARMMRGSDLLATLPKRLERTSFASFANAEPPFKIPAVEFDLVWHRRFELSPRHNWLRKIAFQAAAAMS